MHQRLIGSMIHTKEVLPRDHNDDADLSLLLTHINTREKIPTSCEDSLKVSTISNKLLINSEFQVFLLVLPPIAAAAEAAVMDLVEGTVVGVRAARKRRAVANGIPP